MKNINIDDELLEILDKAGVLSAWNKNDFESFSSRLKFLSRICDIGLSTFTILLKECENGKKKTK
jgi:hypothetical protein